MQIITIMLGEVEGRPTVQVVSSDGVTPGDGESVCTMAAARFREMEIERRVAAALEEKQEEEQDDGSD